MHTSKIKKDISISTTVDIKHQTKPLTVAINLTGKLEVELKTIKKMTRLYCRQHHRQIDCERCHSFVEYAEKKLDRCVYGQDKPACKHCPIHCYKPEQKNLAKIIMRYAGPKMLIMHPILAIKHLLKSRKKFPVKVPTELSNYHLRKITKQ